MSSKLPWPHCRPHGSHNGPVSSPLPEPVKPAHGRGISNDARVSRVSTLHALSSLAKDASTIPHPRLLLRLIDIAQSIDGPQEIQQVLHQILDIIGPLVFELRTKNIPIHNGTPGAAILLILASNVTAIRDIGNQLSNSRCTTLELHDLYAALSRYRENLTKCVKESKSLMSKHMASIGDQNGGGANPSVTRKDISFVVPPVNIYALLRSTAGQAVFEQMSKASLGRVNEITAKSEFLSQDSSNSPPEIVVRTGPNRDDFCHLITTATGANDRFPDKTNFQLRIVQGKDVSIRAIRYSLIKGPLHSVHATPLSALYLLSELQAISRVEMDAAVLADKISALSSALSNLDLADEALCMRTLAAGLYLPLNRGIAFVVALDHISILLSKLGLHEEGLKVTKEVARMYGNLPGTHHRELDRLAQSLLTHSKSLSTVGRHREALPMAAEAVNIYRAAAPKGPPMFRSSLARSLATLSIRLSPLGRHEEALEAIREAVVIYRRAPLERPSAYRPRLASFLSTLALCLWKVGRREESLEKLEEEVTIRRLLAAEEPDRLLSNFASSLLFLSFMYSGLGRNDQAFQICEEAVNTSRRLAKESNPSTSPMLARSLRDLAQCLSKLGRVEEALHAEFEATKIQPLQS